MKRFVAILAAVLSAAAAAQGPTPQYVPNNGTMTGRLGMNFTNRTPLWITWTSPVFNQSVADATAVQQTSTAQGDPYVTPVTRIVSSDAGVNDTAPLYLYHNCNYLTALTPAPCVGEFVVAQNNPGDRHNGVWASNPIAIQYRASVNSLTYGVETNVFNQTNQDAGSPSSPNAAMSYIFGVAATMGGLSGSNGTAAFMATDTNSNAFWWDGLWVQRAKYAAVEAGPIGGNSGLQWSLVSNPMGSAGSGNNYGSVPQGDIASWWNGSASVLEVMKRQFLPAAGSNPLSCYTYTYSTWLGHQFCDNGAVVFLPKNGAQGLRITPDADSEADAAVAVTNAANTLFTFVVLKNGAMTGVGPWSTSGPVQTGQLQVNGIVSAQSSTAIASAATIGPTNQYFHVTGTATITTITAPAGCTNANTMCSLVMIADAAWSLGTGGNIAVALTATPGQRIPLTYDPATTTWYPGGIGGGGGGGGLTGQTSGQVPIANTATSANTSIPTAGGQAALTTGPATSVLHNCPWFVNTSGGIADSGTACGGGGGTNNAPWYNAVTQSSFDNSGSALEGAALVTLMSTQPIVYLQAGTYNVNDGIKFNCTVSTCSGYRIIGAGRDKTILKATACTNGYVLWYNNTSNSPTGDNFKGLHIEHLTIDISSSPAGTSGTACADAVRFTQVALTVMDDVAIIGNGSNSGAVYSTGTIGISGQTVTCSGCTFTSAMVPGVLQVNGVMQEVGTFISGTQLSLVSTSWSKGTVSTGTSYALTYGGRAITCDPGFSYSQYMSFRDVYIANTRFAYYSMGVSSGGCSRISIDGDASWAGWSGSRGTNTVAIWLGKHSDTWDVHMAVNNFARGMVIDSGHANWGRGLRIENNNTWSSVTTCNGGVASQACVTAIELSADNPTQTGYGNEFDATYAYLNGTVFQVDNASGAYNLQIFGLQMANSFSNLLNYSFYGVASSTLGCPNSGTGVQAVVHTPDCNHSIVAATIN